MTHRPDVDTIEVQQRNLLNVKISNEQKYNHSLEIFSILEMFLKEILNKTYEGIANLSALEWEEIDEAIAKSVFLIKSAGGYGKIDFAFENGKLAYSNLHVATNHKKKQTIIEN